MLQQHLEDCYDVRLKNTEALEKLAGQLEPWNRVAVFLDKLTTFLTKYGLRLVWSVVTTIVAAYALALVQSYNASQSAEKAAQASQTASKAASVAATTSATASAKLSHKLDTVIQQTNSAGP